jgi:DNA-binding NarL/FixJ family response regulator
MTTIAIIAPYPTIRAGLHAVVAGMTGVTVLPGIDIDSLASLLETQRPDVLLIDAVEEETRYLDELRELASSRLLVPGVMLLGSTRDALSWLSIPNTSLLLRDATAEEIQSAIRAAADGLVCMDPRIVEELREVIDWQQEEPTSFQLPLSPREIQVLDGISRGWPNKAIPSQLGISEHTVKFHVGSIFRKLDVSSRSEAVAVSTRHRRSVL